MSAWTDFSEIDTSGTDVSLGALASCDIDIIMEQALANTDYINNNFEEKKDESGPYNNNFEDKSDGGSTKMNNEVKVSGMSGGDETSERPDQLPRERLPCSESIGSAFSERKTRKTKSSKRFPCIVCKRKFSEKSEMKDHVRSTHLRHVVLCNVCGKRMFHDKLAKHQQVFHSRAFSI